MPSNQVSEEWDGLNSI